MNGIDSSLIGNALCSQLDIRGKIDDKITNCDVGTSELEIREHTRTNHNDCSTNPAE